MSREFSLRVSEDLAAWVRQQGPPSRVLGAVASAAHRGRLHAAVPDPGPGPGRLTVRIPEQALPRIRELTRSRDSLVALRKLVLAGYEAKMLLGPAVENPALPMRAHVPPLRALPPSSQIEVSPVRAAASLMPYPGARLLNSSPCLENPGFLNRTRRSIPNLAPLAEKRSTGFLAPLADHPVMPWVVVFGFPLLGLLLLFLFAKPKPPARVNALPAVSPLPKDSSWVPEAGSRLAELIW